MRRLVLIPLMLLLSACTIDPCSIDKSSPTCDTRRSEAQATISAIDAERELRATDAAVYLAGQATKSAISSQATRQIVNADATHSAMNTQATRQAISAASTQSAVSLSATQTSIDGEATKIAVSTGALVERARIESAATPYSAVFNITVLWFVIPLAAVLAILIYGRRSVKAVTQSMAQALSKRAALITYGPANNPQMALVLFGADNQPLRIVTTEGLIGPYAELASGDTALAQLNVPDEMKLAALVEDRKRAQAGRIAAATGHSPWSSSVVYDQPVSAPSVAPAQMFAPVPSFAELLRTWKPTPEHMLLGLNQDGAARYCEITGLLSTGVIGKPGSGKSTVLRFHYLQCRLIGARVIVWDLHRTIVKTLPGAEAFTRLEDINQSALDIQVLLQDRIDHDRYDDQPLMILADEFNLLAPNSDDATTAIGRIILEGRKVKMYTMISGQGLPAKLFGSSTPRDALSSRFVLNSTTRQAGIIGLDKDAIPWVVGLQKGAAVVEGPIDAEILHIPNTTEADIRAFLPTSDVFSEPLRPLRATSDEAARTEVLRHSEAAHEAAREVAAEVDPKRAKVAEMLRAGASRNAIIKEIYGATGGERYQRAAAEINQIQKELLT
jgi:hypothetical protein